jgi:hypothetical protein
MPEIHRTWGMVCLIRTLFTGETVEEWLSPMLAVWEALYSPLNGSEVASARVIWGGVSSGTVDTSGSALVAEIGRLVGIREGYDNS